MGEGSSEGGGKGGGGEGKEEGLLGGLGEGLGGVFVFPFLEGLVELLWEKRRGCLENVENLGKIGAMIRRKDNGENVNDNYKNNNHEKGAMAPSSSISKITNNQSLPPKNNT